MKKIIILFAFCLFIWPQFLFAESAKIIDFQGEVMVKRGAGSGWTEAAVDQLLEPGAEIETRADSLCAIAFDKNWSNVIRLKENTRIRIESVIPGEVKLTEGRVFSLIQQLEREQGFQVRTPTAIAAARGTGWSTGYNSGVTRILCFLDAILLHGLDSQGNIANETNLGAGSGAEVGSGGILSALFRLSGADYDEWNAFMEYLLDLLGLFYDDLSGQSLEDAIWENKEEIHERIVRDIRSQNETSSSDDNGNGDNNRDVY